MHGNIEARREAHVQARGKIAHFNSPSDGEKKSKSISVRLTHVAMDPEKSKNEERHAIIRHRGSSSLILGGSIRMSDGASAR
jgi:hypothetical protein